MAAYFGDSEISDFTIYNVNCNHKNTAIRTGMGTASRGVQYDVLACQEISEPCEMDGYSCVAFGRDKSHTLNTALFFRDSNIGWQKQGSEISLSISAKTKRAACGHVFSSRKNAKIRILVLNMHLKSGERFEGDAAQELIILAKYAFSLAKLKSCSAFVLIGDLNWADPEVCADMAGRSLYDCALLYGEDQMSGRSLMGGAIFYLPDLVDEVENDGKLALTHEGHAITGTRIKFK